MNKLSERNGLQRHWRTWVTFFSAQDLLEQNKCQHQQPAKEVIVKQIIVIAATSMCVYTSIVSAQQTQETALAQQAPDTSGTPATSGTSGAPPIAGRSPIGVAAVEMDEIIIGWSTKKEILGKRVMNDAKERIGEIEDVIITPQKAASYAIIGVGGFLGLGERRVAIPFQQLKLQGTDFVLVGATKDALKSLPEFKYARK